MMTSKTLSCALFFPIASPNSNFISSCFFLRRSSACLCICAAFFRNKGSYKTQLFLRVPHCYIQMPLALSNVTEIPNTLLILVNNK